MEMANISKRGKAELYLLLVTIIWGGTFAVTKMGLGDASPLMFLAIRCSVAGILFTAFYYKKFKILGRSTYKAGLILGVLMFLGYGLQTIGLNYTTASRAGFITFTYALLVPFLQYYFLKKKPGIGNSIGLGIVFIGLYILTNPSQGNLNIGDTIMFGCAIAYGFYIIYLDKYTQTEDPVVLTAMQFAVAAVLSFIFSPIVETPFINLSMNLLWSIAYLALLGSIVCTYFMTLYQRDTTPMRAVIIYSLEPVISVVLAVILIGEAFTNGEMIGAVLIMLGALTSQCWPYIFPARASLSTAP